MVRQKKAQTKENPTNVSSKKVNTYSKKKNSKKIIQTTPTATKFYDQLKLSESYISLVLGAAVVLGVSVLFIVFLRESRNNQVSPPEVLNSAVSPEVTQAPQVTYIIGENETLWDVAVKHYGDGFRYVDIIEANNFENPDYVPPGTKIIIPNSE